jgi:L-ribulokinase
MGRVERDVWKPDPARADAYDALFDIYRQLHDEFGATGGDLMHRLRRIRKDAVDR